MATIIEPERKQQPAGRPAPAVPVETPPPVRPRGGKRIAFAIMGVVVLALLGFGVRRYVYGLSHVSTDNAQVDGHIIPILPKVGGFVTDVQIKHRREMKKS